MSRAPLDFVLDFVMVSEPVPDLNDQSYSLELPYKPLP